jgi:serine/threonine-protein kinase RsbW
MDHFNRTVSGDWALAWDGSRKAGSHDRFRAFGKGPEANSDVRLTLPARPENIAVVRHVLAALAEALDLPTQVVDDLRLAVTEACTNVVRHAYQDGEGPIEVIVHPDAATDAIVVTVADRGRGIAPSEDRAGPGLGLPLIASLADDLKIEHGPDAGSRVSMFFRRAPRPDRWLGAG